MGYGSQFYIVALLTIVYPLMLVGVVLAVRYMGRKQAAAAGGGERRRRPLLRKVLNALAFVPVIFIVGYVSLQFRGELENGGVALKPEFYLLCALAVLYPVLLTMLIVRLRRLNGGTRDGKEERRKRLGLRRLVNALIIAPALVFALAALTFLVPRF